MASGNTIIIGGGIASASPFTIGQFPVIVLTDPATVTDGNIRQDTSTPPKVYIGDASVFAGSTVIGGATLTGSAIAHVAIGSGATVATTSAVNASVVIGRSAINGTGNGNVVIGDRANAAGSGATSSSNVVIGRLANIGVSAGGANNVVIGDSADLSLGSQQVLIGPSAQMSANNLNVAIGYSASVTGGAGIANCVVVGPSSNTNRTQNTLIGYGLANTHSNNICIVGCSWSSTANMPANTCGFLASNGLTTMIVGNNHEAAAPGSLTFRLCNGLGANIAAGSLTLQAGLGTGTGASAVVNLASSIPVGAGSTLQTSRTGFRMSPSVTAGQTDIMVYDVDNATLERVTVGAADSGGVGFKVLRIPN